jgi:putative nucleotidyltransferase-like protein
VESSLWRTLERLLAETIAARRGAVDGVLAHKLGPLAAGAYEHLGMPVPQSVREEQRAASVGALLAPILVRRLRDAVDGELVLLKGPEVAALYPAAGRRYADIDVLAPDADAVQAALLQAGFVETDAPDLEEHHHLPPLQLPEVWLGVEIHAAPNWPPAGGPPPTFGEIFEAAVPSTLGIEGVSAPCRAHHALLLAAHAWRHQPLHLLRDLLDIAVLAEGVPPGELDAVAQRWGIGKVWRTTRAATGALFYGEREPLPLKLWARHLRQVRPETVLEEHLQRWLHPFWEQSPTRALGDSLGMIRRDLTPAAGETWRTRLRVGLDAVRHLRSPAASRDRS